MFSSSPDGGEIRWKRSVRRQEGNGKGVIFFESKFLNSGVSAFPAACCRVLQ
jgi:hypothetical protein